jgi:SAM-dependent methyltransferase
MQSDAADELMAANKANWDDRTSVHLASGFYDVEGWLRSGRGPREREVAALGDVAGLSLVHLQCHFGLDTLAWARAGATVTGLDFSPAAVDAARNLAERSGLASMARFVCANVYEARRALDHENFDIVYVSLGALCWLPDVARWAQEVGGLLKPGGRFYIHDVHPVAWALDEDGRLLAYSYFEEDDPYVDDSEATYTDADRGIEPRRTYEWNHGIGEIVTALTSQGLKLEWLVEHDWTVLQRFPWLVEDSNGNWTSPPGAPRLPLTFTILASRPT